VRAVPVEVAVGDPLPVDGRPDIGTLRDAARAAVAGLLADDGAGGAG